MVVLFPNMRAIEVSKESMSLLNFAASCVLHASDSKGSPVGDKVVFHATTDVAVSLNPNCISISLLPSALPMSTVSINVPALSIRDTFA
jgi:hypothetical protein